MTGRTHPRPAVLVTGLVAVLALAVTACGSSTRTTTDTAVSTSTASTSTPASTTSSTTAIDTATAVFPTAGGQRYSDPVAAATAFATQYVGFVNPVVGTFRQGDSRSGEVEVRPNTTGPVTTVMVRQLGQDGSWWVLGSATANIVLAEPSTGATVTSPVTLKGTSTAFEGTVRTEVREDGNATPLGTGFVTGGSMGVMGPFTGSLAFTTPTAQAGALLLTTVSMENGHVWEASTIRVKLG